MIGNCLQYEQLVSASFSPFLSAGSELGKLPRAEDLQVVLEFSLPQEKVTAANKSGATNLLSLLSESAEKEAARVPSPFSAGSCLPAVPRKTAEKIWAGEYIDFSDIPPARGKAKSLPSSMEGHIIGCRPCSIKETDPRHGYMDSVLCSLRGHGHGKRAWPGRRSAGRHVHNRESQPQVQVAVVDCL